MTAASRSPSPASDMTSCRYCAAVSDDPATTLPMPRSPAAMAPCQASGPAARVMRAACTEGTSPCSAMATRQASIMAR
jgi:hypothetical protein